MNIDNYGVSKRCEIAKELVEHAIDRLHLVFLPIPTSRDNIHVKDTHLLLSDVTDTVREGTLVVGYKIPCAVADEIIKRGARYLDLSLDEQFLLDNANLTALGALGYLLTSSPLAMPDMRVGVVGYGRIGRALVRSLAFLGARLKVYTTSRESAVALAECGIDVTQSGIECGGVRDFSGLDVVINTAPADMRASFADGKIPEGMRVIELASGENFKGIDGVERLPSIPEQMYPTSGGYVYFSAIKRFLREDES